MTNPLDRLFPHSPDSLDAWRRRHGTTLEEARRRFAQFVILEAISESPDLAAAIAFKGGNALRFLYGSRRSTLDLDFTARADFPDDEGQIRAILDRALLRMRPRYLLRAKCQRVRRNPPGKDKTRPTYAVSVAYALPADRAYQDFDGRTSLPAVVEVEITLNDVLCETTHHRLHPEGGLLVVCTLEDIVAEKLRALLQQIPRNRSRPQDVHDIAQVLRGQGATLDVVKVARYLVAKATARDIEPRKSGFDAEVRARALLGYENLLASATTEWLPFDEAWVLISALVARLEIPE